MPTCTNNNLSIYLMSNYSMFRDTEMLMKEFKSAHSKMFSKRKGATNNSEEDQEQQVKQHSDDKMPATTTTTTPKQRTTIKTINTTTKKAGLVPQPSIHLAAAN